MKRNPPFGEGQARREMIKPVEEMKQKITPVLVEHGVIHAAVFGSFVRGEESKGSDLDILVEFGEGKSLLDLVALKLDLETLLGRKVDVVTRNALHPRIRESVLEEQVVIM